MAVAKRGAQGGDSRDSRCIQEWIGGESMNDEEYDFDFDLESTDPFSLFGMLGLGLADQEDGNTWDDEDDETNGWDDDVYLASFCWHEWAFGDWGLTVNGLDWDGSPTKALPPIDEISVYDHIRLVLETRRLERQTLQNP